MYVYEIERAKVFSEEGQVMFLKVRDNMSRHCGLSGAVGYYRATEGLTGDSWTILACIDRLIELGEFECIYNKGAGQTWIYRAKP